jgi:hypothetical protein
MRSCAVGACVLYLFTAAVHNHLVLPLQVSDREAKGYSAVIKNKMALSNMKTKQMRRDYSSIDEFNEDVELIVSNCLTFNITSVKYQDVSPPIPYRSTVTAYVSHTLCV